MAGRPTRAGRLGVGKQTKEDGAAFFSSRRPPALLFFVADPLLLPHSHRPGPQAVPARRPAGPVRGARLPERHPARRVSFVGVWGAGKGERASAVPPPPARPISRAHALSPSVAGGGTRGKWPCPAPPPFKGAALMIARPTRRERGQMGASLGEVAAHHPGLTDRAHPLVSPPRRPPPLLPSLPLSSPATATTPSAWARTSTRSRSTAPTNCCTPGGPCWRRRASSSPRACR